MQPGKTIDEQYEERPFPVKRLKTAATNTKRFKTFLATTRKLQLTRKNGVLQLLRNTSFNNSFRRNLD